MTCADDEVAPVPPSSPPLPPLADEDEDEVRDEVCHSLRFLLYKPY